MAGAACWRAGRSSSSPISASIRSRRRARSAGIRKRDVPIGILATLLVCTILYIGVAVVLTGMVPWQSVAGDAAPVVNALKRVSLTPGGGIACTGCGWRCCSGAIVGMISSILVFQLGQARVWFAMSRDRLLPECVQQGASAVPDAGVRDLGCWRSGGDSGGAVRRRDVRGDVEHRDAVCVCAGVDWRDCAAVQGAGAASRVPRSVWAGDSCAVA